MLPPILTKSLPVNSSYTVQVLNVKQHHRHKNRSFLCVIPSVLVSCERKRNEWISFVSIEIAQVWSMETQKKKLLLPRGDQTEDVTETSVGVKNIFCGYP